MTEYEMIIDLSKRVRRLEEDMYFLKNQNCSKSIKSDVALEQNDTVDIVQNVHDNIHVDSSVNKNRIPRQLAEPVAAQVKQHSSINIENKIGKNLMGFAAAILIFSSLILFGGLLFSYITDTMKFGIMSIVSIVLLCFGLFKMNVESKYNVLFSSIAGIGAGSFYITCLIGYFGFELLSDLVLIVCLSCWLVVTTILSRLKSKMFMYVSNIGLIIATILVCVNWPELYIGIILYFIGLVALYCCNMCDNYKVDVLFFIQVPVMSFILCGIYNNLLVCICLLLIVSCLYVFQIIKYDIFDSKQCIYFMISLLVTMFCQFLTVCVCDMLPAFGFEYSDDYILTILLYVFMLIYGVAIYIKHSESNCLLLHTWSVCFAIFSLVLHWNVLDSLEHGLKVISFWPLFLLFVVIGFVKNHKFERCIGYIFYYLSLLNAMFTRIIYDNDVYSTAVCIVTLFAIFIVAAYVIKNYSMFDKYFMVFFVLFFIAANASLFDTPSWFLILEYSIFSICLNTKFFRYSPDGYFEQSSAIIGYVINVITMFVMSVNLSNTDTLIYSVVNILCLIGLYCVNIKHILDIGLPNVISGLYLSLKFTFLLFVLLSFFNTVSYVLSIVFLLFSVACIVIGFRVNQKVFRVYGLVLTLFSVVKLILFDIEYGQSILRPIGFFVAGVLCLVISWLYSRLERQLSNDN